MFDDNEPRPSPSRHEIGMKLDDLSVEELNERIAMLQAEIKRLEQAIADRGKTRSEAESIFKR